MAQPVDPGTTNRMAYYTMEGDAKDGSGRGYNGTLVGEPVFINGEAGYGQSLLFDGVNDYVDLPIAPLLGTLTSATFTARVNFDSSGNTGWERVFDFGTGETVYMFLTLRQGTTGLMRAGITLTGNTNQSNVDAGVPLPMGWHHVAVVIDGSTKIMQICLDGSPVGSGPTTLVPKDLGTTTQNWLGRSQWTADGYYKGMMDDFAIYDRALSEGELRYLAGDR